MLFMYACIKLSLQSMWGSNSWPQDPKSEVLVTEPARHPENGFERYFEGEYPRFGLECWGGGAAEQEDFRILSELLQNWKTGS